MCASIGVDPLASGKGFWSNMLDIGDFYYELGVQIVEVCMASQHKTGGLMELGEIRHKLIRARGRSEHHQEITLDDLLRATKKLKVLGTGFTVIPLGSGRHLVQSVPGEMSLDQVGPLWYLSILLLKPFTAFNKFRKIISKIFFFFSKM